MNEQGRQRLILAAMGVLGVTAVMTQLALLRELLGAFAGNEMVLGSVLGSWLLLTGLGTWAGRASRFCRRPDRLLVGLLVLVAVLPLVEVAAVRLLRNVVFVRGALVGVTETVGASLVVLLPFCVVSGFLLTLGCVLLREPAGLGRVYVADTVGSVAGGVLFSFVLVHWLDHLALLVVPAVLSLAVAATVAWFGRAKLLAVLLVTGAALVAGLATLEVDRLTTQWQLPGQRIVFRGQSPYGKLVVTETAGQFNFIVNGLPFLTTHNIEQVEETVHYALAQRPAARQVLLIGGGVSGTAREILKYPRATVTYVELDPLIITAGQRFLPGHLADDRLRVVTTDGRSFIQRTTERFDVVIVDLPEPSTSQLNRFYTAEFFGEVKQALAPDGVLSFALGRYENYVSPELGRLLAVAHRTVQTQFRNVRLLPGGRVFFLASDGELRAEFADRVAGPTRLVNRQYLAATLTPDRQADLDRAVAAPAAVNRDFAPVLYFEHLRYWLRQYGARFGVVEAVLGLGLVVYVVRLRAVPLAVFAGGFAAAALEVVLLLAFQILYGSVYRQVGVLVTVFMAGLAVGAWLGNRLGGARLAGLAAGVAGFAAVVPGLLGVGWLIAPLTFGLAVLVGMEFPVAARTEFAGAGPTAARLFTADLVGACLGALLVSALLLPVLGVTAACWLTAGLNAVAAVAVGRKTT